MRPLTALLIVLAAHASAQDARVMEAVQAALQPALPFPASDADGVLPADGTFSGPWIVRPVRPGEQTIEVIANPLNREHQLRSAKAMAQIGDSIQSAQRRADAQYERALEEAKRTGRSQEVDGVTLADEGVAGARIDADSHVTIDLVINEPSYRRAIASSVMPAPPKIAIARASVLSVPANVYRDADGVERFCEAESYVFFGSSSPEVRRRADHLYDVTATGLVGIRLRGNEALIADILKKADWGRVAELLQ
jgi:hypothetical protein